MQETRKSLIPYFYRFLFKGSTNSAVKQYGLIKDVWYQGEIVKTKTKLRLSLKRLHGIPKEVNG